MKGYIESEMTGHSADVLQLAWPQLQPVIWLATLYFEQQLDIE